jgi:hypothetical protein
MRAVIARTPSVRPQDFRTVASQSLLPVDAHQLGSGRGFEDYTVRSLDSAFLGHTTFKLGAIARGYGSSRTVWVARAAARVRGRRRARRAAP